MLCLAFVQREAIDQAERALSRGEKMMMGTQDYPKYSIGRQRQTAARGAQGAFSFYCWKRRTAAITQDAPTAVAAL
jgi:uncharacterized short protein YbdD (DUF466 family)